MRAGNRASRALLLLLLLGPGGAAAAGHVPRVRDVEIRLDAPLGRGFDLRPLVVFGPGIGLTEPAVRRTLSNFYATGLVAEVEVLTRPAAVPEGLADPAAQAAEWVTVVVVVRGRTWVDTVELEGDFGLRESTLRDAVEQPPDAPLSEESLLRGHYALQDLYRRYGYRQARVRLAVDVERGSKRAAVVYHLDSGPRSVVSEVSVAGDSGPFDPAALRAALRTRAGDPYDRERVAADRERLSAWWAERGHPAAKVEPARTSWDPETHQVRLTFPVDAGPAVAVEVTGISRKRLERRGLLPFLDASSFDEELVAQSCERIAGYLQRKGHFRARAEYRLEQEEGLRRVVLEVEPGPVYRLEKVRFEGNQHVADDELLPLLSTAVRQRLRPGSGRLVLGDLTEDLANLRSFYLLQGFPEIEIGPEAIYENGTRLELVIPVREGQRQRLVDLTLSGNQVLTSDEVLAALPLRRGAGFHPILVEDSVNVVRALYEEKGYRSASVEPRLDWNDERTLVDVHLTIYEGPQLLLDRVVLRGYRYSRPDVLRRFVRLERGEPISRRRLLEAERELYRLGIFSRVDVDLAPATESLTRRDVIVRLEEGKRWRLGYGLSYNTEDGLGGLLSVTRWNLGGRGDRLQLDLRGSGLDRRFRLLYDKPTIWNRNLPITYSLFEQEEERQSFTVNEIGSQISLIKDFRGLRAGLVYEYRLVDLSGEVIDLGEIERERRELEISSLTPNLFIDRRDDPLDPTRGWSTSLQLEAAIPFLGADADFVKLFWQQTGYRSLGSLGLLAASVRFGAIEPASGAAPDPTVPAGLASARVPVSERFFGGGRTSHRAFERDRLGIVGETVLEREGGGLLELGGNGLFILNLDYRFPIAGPLGGTFFVDVGNVWADWRDLDPGELEAGAGVGVRYRSPIGPVRLEIGWKIGSDLGEADKPVFFLSFGNPF